jgi:hypothetical protein
MDLKNLTVKDWDSTSQSQAGSIENWDATPFHRQSPVGDLLVKSPIFSITFPEDR